MRGQTSYSTAIKHLVPQLLLSNKTVVKNV